MAKLRWAFFQSLEIGVQFDANSEQYTKWSETHGRNRRTGQLEPLQPNKVVWYKVGR